MTDAADVSSAPGTFTDATALAEQVRRGEVRPEELVEDAIKRIEAVNDQVNAVIIPTYEKGRREATTAGGPFAGVPYLVKDTIATKGDLFTNALFAVKNAGYRATEDAALVERFREAGFALLGKTNLPEMALVSTTESIAWGQCRNPWDLTRSVGGSSGGAAVAVATGMVPVAHGSDGGGSIREPASKCGVVGIKPTRGRLTQGPVVMDSDNVSGMAHEGLLARTIRDVAGVLDAVGGRFAGDPYGAAPPLRRYVEEVGADPGRLRIGVCTTDPAGQFEVDADCAAGVRKVADVLSDLGHDVAEGFPEAIRDESWPLPFMPAVAVVVSREVRRFGNLIGRELTENDLEPQTWAYVQLAKQVSGEQYAAGIDALRTQAVATERWWEEEGWDIWLTPSLTIQTPGLGEFKPTKEDPFGGLGMEPSRFEVPSNVSGQPSISLPLHHAGDGLPLGVLLTGAYGREDVLIRISSQLEHAMPWIERIPPIHA